MLAGINARFKQQLCPRAEDCIHHGLKLVPTGQKPSPGGRAEKSRRNGVAAEGLGGKATGGKSLRDLLGLSEHSWDNFVKQLKGHQIQG